jgi:hypothetical protein
MWFFFFFNLFFLKFGRVGTFFSEKIKDSRKETLKWQFLPPPLNSAIKKPELLLEISLGNAFYHIDAFR